MPEKGSRAERAQRQGLIEGEKSRKPVYKKQGELAEGLQENDLIAAEKRTCSLSKAPVGLLRKTHHTLQPKGGASVGGGKRGKECSLNRLAAAAGLRKHKQSRSNEGKKRSSEDQQEPGMLFGGKEFVAKEKGCTHL